MKRFLILLSILCCSMANAQTETINWYVEGTQYATTTCEIGNDVILPTTPTKYGYTFMGWKKNYRNIEYIQKKLNTYNTPTIDTGLQPSQNIKFRLKLSFEDLGSGSMIIIAKNNYTKYRFYTFNQNLFALDMNSTSKQARGISNNVIYDVLVGPVYIKDYETEQILTGSETNNEFYIDDHIIIEWHNSSMKLYSASFWENDTPVRDFIPVLNSSGQVCLYEKVEGKFYCNFGNGTVSAGPIIDE